MKKRLPISKIMTTNLVTLNTTDELGVAEGLFKKHNIRHIPVVNGDHIIGMLSYTDLLRISFADSIDKDERDIDTTVYNLFTLEQVMVKNVVTISPTATVKEVAELLAEKEFHAVPVVENSKLVGIVTTTDLIKLLLEQF